MSQGPAIVSSRPKRRLLRRTRRAVLPTVKPPELRSDINVTPLVDVVLVLLIIFMVVTPMLSRGVAVDLPSTRYHEKKSDTGKQIVVSVAREGRIFVDADVVVLDTLSATLRRDLDERSKGGGQRELHVKADRNLTFGEVKKVLDAIHGAGVQQVAFGTEDEKGQ